MLSELIIRPRRLRRSLSIREMFQQVCLKASDFIYPLFIVPGALVKKPISSLADQFHFSPDMAAQEASRVFDLGIKSILLFGLPSHKDSVGSSGADPEGPVQLAIKAIKKAVPEMIVITDVCLCEYTDHGHCGLIHQHEVDNDSTLPHLANQALSHAESGADMVAPSDMMDGRVGAIRALLDKNGFSQTSIMAYSVKYASFFYGPFREAAGSAPGFGDRRAYQMDPSRPKEALLEVELDVAEGADIVMVKPAGAYLDIISQVRDHCLLPLAAYQVSGEFAMLKCAAAQGLIEEKGAALESLLAIKRAGADLIITYFAPQAAQWLKA